MGHSLATASPDQQQVSPEGNTWPSRSPGEGRASHVLLARPGARYPQGLSTRGQADTGGAAPRRKRAAWGAKGHWCLGTSGAQPDATLLQLRAQNRVGHTGGWKERSIAASQTRGSQGERRTRNPGVNSAQALGSPEPPGDGRPRGASSPSTPETTMEPSESPQVNSQDKTDTLQNRDAVLRITCAVQRTASY